MQRVGAHGSLLARSPYALTNPAEHTSQRMTERVYLFARPYAGICASHPRRLISSLRHLRLYPSPQHRPRWRLLAQLGRSEANQIHATF